MMGLKSSEKLKGKTIKNNAKNAKIVIIIINKLI